MEAFGSRIRKILYKAYPGNLPMVEHLGKEFFAKGLPMDLARQVLQAKPLDMTQAVAKAVELKEVDAILASGKDGPPAEPPEVPAPEKLAPVATTPVVHTLVATASGSQGGSGSHQSAREHRKSQTRQNSSAAARGKKIMKQCYACGTNDHWPSQCEYRLDGPKAGQLTPAQQSANAAQKRRKSGSRSRSQGSNSGAPNGAGGSNPPTA